MTATPPSPVPAATVLLEADNLCFAYPPLVLFDRWSARIAPGVTAVLGGDGRGKTTLLRLLAGELPAQGGSLRVGDVSLHGQPGAYRQQVFWVDPRSDAMDALTVPQCFETLARRHPAFDTSLLDGLIDGLSLTEHRHKPLYMLSTGSRRKVWLAAALASGAAVLLLDNPFGALDKASIRFVTAQLQAAAQRGVQAVLVADYQAPEGVPLAGTLDLGD